MNATPAVPTVRRMDFAFADPHIPAHWWGADRELTRNADALHLLFPAGERFFVRSVRHYASGIQDPVLRERVQGFVGQEAMHGHEHRRAFALLRRDGLEIDTFLAAYEAHIARLESRASPLLNLSVTCALEHLTATLGAQAFSDPLIADAHPVMADLMLWHAAEEVEHKSVAFDVYRAVGGGYALRILGMVLAYGFLMKWWTRGARHLLEQDGGYSQADLRALRRRTRAAGVDVLGDFRRAAVAYLRPSFHPDDVDDQHLAIAYFAERAAKAS